MKNRVVITGIGIISPIGIGKEEFWSALINGKSGIGRITLFDASEFPTKIAGEVKNFYPEEFMDKKSIKKSGRFTHFAVASAKLALRDWGDSEIEKFTSEEFGIYIGTATGGMDIFEREHFQLQLGGVRYMSPFGSMGYFPHSPAVEIGVQLNCKASVFTISTGCTGGIDAVGLAFRDIQRGKKRIAIAGGTDASITPLTMGSLCAAGVTSTKNDFPEKASRPFDLKRDGGILSEGAGVFIIENMEQAISEGRKIYGEIIGYSSNTEAHSSYDPDLDGHGFSVTMEEALMDGGIFKEEVDYISAHAPSDPLIDVAETRAIKRVFGKRAYNIPVSSIKSMIGNPLASAGPFQIAGSLLVLNEGIIPPTINYEFPDPECDLDVVPNVCRKNEVEIVLLNVHAFGGTNSCMILRRFTG
ncbi:beta-ketoacyl-[acyl-carrier-protein] synthase family protein [bacterium]|nr:beta-ketoacyl-[acyl-carrier-protein] synthase family protein [bacterium]